jgi:LPS sulfotransferase NodH
VRDFFGPEFDEAPTPGRRLLVAYVVCSTPRSGSGLLCRGLAATRQLATPLEYLNPELRMVFAERWGSGPTLDAYLDALHARRTTATGVFGLKMHWTQLEQAAIEAGASPAELLERVAPSSQLVRITRQDRVAQAVSLWRAGRSGVWSPVSGAAYEEQAEYDFDEISGCLGAIERAERAWDDLLAGADPLVVEYEQLARDYAGTVARVARHLGTTGVTVPPPTTRRLADARSAELATRFRDEFPQRAPS